MKRKRTETPEHVKKEIQRLVKTQPQLKKTDIAKKLGVSNSVVYYHTNPVIKKMCEACGRRPVPDKPIEGVILRKLCLPCFKAGRPTIIQPRKKIEGAQKDTPNLPQVVKKPD